MGIQHERGQVADGHPAEQEQDGAEHADHGQRQVVDEGHGRAGEGAVVVGLVVGVHRGVVALVEPGEHDGLPVVGLGGLLAGDDLLHEAVELTQGGGTLAEQGPDPLGHVPGEQDC